MPVHPFYESTTAETVSLRSAIMDAVRSMADSLNLMDKNHQPIAIDPVRLAQTYLLEGLERDGYPLPWTTHQTFNATPDAEMSAILKLTQAKALSQQSP